MARLPAVLELLSAADSRPSGPKWEIVARDLRRAGCLTEGKRGLGSAPVSLQDAANLLIAGMATSSPSKGPEVVELYRGMRLEPGSVGPFPEAISDAVEEVSFGSALELMLAAGVQMDGQSWRLLLSIQSPIPRAVVAVYGRNNLGELVEIGRVAWSRAVTDIRSFTGDLQVSTEAKISERTLVALSRLIFS